ncbi:hypothetical protein UFOVP410_168 [uncultured Caudovirales phage]|uniref:Uncharacterized protein n=1 Tax=uncultured Caudovirales phage TaxID=2100421 RepID=A0A6J5MC37_9CAUD|nr:hypothetical protein UFOVP410_168 [uncultured Caudovirales phage]
METKCVKLSSKLEAKLSFMDKNALLILNSFSDKVEIQLTQTTINELLHLLTVASIETEERYVKV